MRRFFTTLRCTICPKLACVGDPHEWGSKGIINPRPQGSIYKKYCPAFPFPGVRSIPFFGFRSIPVFCSCVFAAFPCFNCFVFPWVLVQYTYTHLTIWGVKIWRISARRFFTTLRCEICPNLDFVGDPHEWGSKGKTTPRPPDSIYENYQMDLLFVCAYLCVCRSTYTYTDTYFSYLPKRWLYATLNVVLFFSGWFSPLSGVKICAFSLLHLDVKFTHHWLLWGTPTHGGRKE